MTATQAEAMEEARRVAEEGSAGRFLEWLAERIGARAGVTAVFGEPIERGDITVIPVARVRWGFGGGEGQGGEAEGPTGSAWAEAAAPRGIRSAISRSALLEPSSGRLFRPTRVRCSSSHRGSRRPSFCGPLVA